MSNLQDLIVTALSKNPAVAGFDVHYQPLVRLADSTIVGVEALARWRHELVGEVPPRVFVAIAERAGLTGALDDFVLNRACASARVLTQACCGEVDLHVNVSASRLGRPDLEAALAWALNRHRLRPERLVIEIVDSSRITDIDAASAAIRRLRDKGVNVALDDFGAGLNTSAQLQALPANVVKLDAMLSTLGEEGWHTEGWCRSALASCAELSLTAIAEGVETPAQAHALRDLGCRFAQGFLYGPALPLTQLAAHVLRLKQRAQPRLVAREYSSSRAATGR